MAESQQLLDYNPLVREPDNQQWEGESTQAKVEAPRQERKFVKIIKSWLERKSTRQTLEKIAGAESDEDGSENQEQKSVVEESDKKIEELYERILKENNIQGLISTDELPFIVGEHIGEFIDLFPKIPKGKKSLKLEYIENLEPGNYVLPERPSIEFLRQFTEYYNGTSEIGILCVDKRWMVQTGKKGELRAGYHKILQAVQRQMYFQADIHSHPGSDPGTYQPSIQDILSLKGTVDNINYIVTDKGFLEFRLPGRLPGETRNPGHDELWNRWITEDKKLSTEEFENSDGWELRREFLEKYYRMKIIPWDRKKEINEILKSKEELRPYPLKSKLIRDARKRSAAGDSV